MNSLTLNDSYLKHGYQNVQPLILPSSNIGQLHSAGIPMQSHLLSQPPSGLNLIQDPNTMKMTQYPLDL